MMNSHLDMHASLIDADTSLSPCRPTDRFNGAQQSAHEEGGHIGLSHVTQIICRPAVSIEVL
jgi:hypothetical protein